MPDTEPLVPAALELLDEIKPHMYGREMTDLRALLLEVQAQAAEVALKDWHDSYPAAVAQIEAQAAERAVAEWLASPEAAERLAETYCTDVHGGHTTGPACVGGYDFAALALAAK